MKFKAFCVLLILSVFLLAGCGCQHEWVEADCVNPRTCTLCEKTEGEALAHDWKEADCEQPKTCMRCAQTEGAALGHDWAEATCEAPKTCKTCKLQEGSPLEHDYQTWWIPDSNTIRYVCKVCDYQEEEANTHQNALRRILRNTAWESVLVGFRDSGKVLQTNGEHVITFDDQYGFHMKLGEGEEYAYSGTWTADRFADENETLVHYFVATDEAKKVRCKLELYLKINGVACENLVLELDAYTMYFAAQKEEVSAPIQEETVPEQPEGLITEEAPVIYTDEKYGLELEKILDGLWETTTMYVSSQAAECPLSKADFTDQHTVEFTRADVVRTGTWTFTGYELLENANGPGSKQDVYFFDVEMDNGEHIQCAANHFEDYDVLSVIDLYGENQILSFSRS